MQNAVAQWIQFVEHGQLDNGKLNPIVYQSWQRSREFQVCHDRSWGTDVLSAGSLREKVEQNKELIMAAVPVMNDLFGVLRGLGFMVVLADAEGFILKSLVDEGFSKHARQVMLCEGANWGEQIQGTNAIGTSLAEHKPVNIIGHEHYVRVNHNLACSAVPIFGADGSLVGTLDATGDGKKGSSRILGMVTMAVRSIERELQVAKLRNSVDQYKSCYRNVVDLIREGTVVVDETGVIREISPITGQVLGIKPEEYLGANIEELLNVNNIWVLDASAPDAAELTIGSRNGSLVNAKARKVLGPDGEARGMVALISPVEAARGIVIPGRPEIPQIRNGSGVRFTFNNIIGKSKYLQNVIAICRRVAHGTSTVLLTGETGTGKEMLAQAIHQESSRKSGPFVAVNCAAIPAELVESELFGYEEGAFTGAAKGGSPGKFERAHGGTIFLDEIGDMPLRAQVSLLRVLQEKQLCRVGGQKFREIDVRVVAATHRNLTEMVNAGSFREDLFFRLNVVNINIPALRERSEDVELLISFFMQKYTHDMGRRDLRISTEAMAYLAEYSWPGNVRELENVIEGLVNMVDEEVVTVDHLPPRIRSGEQPEPDLSGTLRDIEKTAIIQAIADNPNSLSAAAAKLGIGRSTLYRKLKEYEIDQKNLK